MGGHTDKDKAFENSAKLCRCCQEFEVRQTVYSIQKQLRLSNKSRFGFGLAKLRVVFQKNRRREKREHLAGSNLSKADESI